MLAMARTACLTLLVAALAVAGCGGSSKKSNGASAGALSAEARSAATGDIPDNQVFLVFTDRGAGYSIKYPEGWARTGHARDVTFADKNNIVRIVVGSGAAPSPQSVGSELARQQTRTPSLRVTSPPRSVTIKGKRVVTAVYTTESKPNAVTGKRVLLVVDRYELARGGKRAIVDLGTPKGVDNVDAYRLMVESFRWL
jgi:hypothetical protein